MKPLGRRTAITSTVAAVVAACTPSRMPGGRALAQSAAAAGNEVEITVDGLYRYIRSNGIPNHVTGQFPNRNNPHAIAAQNHVYRVPLNPQVAAQPTPLGLSPFGIALNGVPFDPGAAEYWRNDPNSGWRYEALSGAVSLGLDAANAHVQPSGAYHYHGLPAPLVAGQSAHAHSDLIGYAADGFPIYALYGYVDPQAPASGVARLRSSYRLKSGTRPDGPGGAYDGSFVQDYEYVAGFGDLDECNGRRTVTPDYPGGTYAYYLTDDFPVIPRCLRGAPDRSFLRRGGGPAGPTSPGGPGSRPGGGGPPPRR